MNLAIRSVSLLFAFLVLAAGLPWAATLVKDGKATAVIVLPAQPDNHEKLAAKDLADYVAKMSGATLEVKNLDAAGLDAFLGEAKKQGQRAVVLGSLALPRLQGALGDKAAVRGAFALQADNSTVYAAGNVEGTYYAVIELLEQLGCRWFMPGDLGEVVPALKTIDVRAQTTVQAPSFPSRHFQMPDRDWQARVRCGGNVFLGGHGIPEPAVKVSKDGEFEPKEYAEFFALVKGKRVKRQHCVSNPAFVKFVIAEVKKMRKAGRGPVLGMGPNDGAGFCKCENCRALDTGDFDAFSGEPSVTDRYIWFYNQVLKGVEDEYPDTKLAFYIYHTYMRPPLREKPDPRITGALAPIALDRVHGFSNPIAPEKSYEKWLFQEWGKIMPELYDRGYWSNLACPGFTFIIIDRLRDEIPACYDFGVKGWRVETFPNYGPQFPSMYIAGKLMWNHQADVDALLADCSEKFFGPAKAPMGQYITLMDAALRDGDYCTGSSWDIPNFYPPALRKQARALLDEGLKLSQGSGIYEQRVKMIVQTFDMTEAFCEMMEARVRVDFTAAKASLEKCDIIANELMTMKPVPMVSAGRHSTYVNYMNRFFRRCTEQGYARVTGGNVLVAAAGDEWQFQIDPQQIGEDIGLWRPENRGGNWQKINTSSSSWSNQGLRYYKGLAWYRTTVEVPKDAAGKRLFLWCGGVDETAKVWLNGQVIGISPGATFYPFEMDATGAVKAGKNQIVMCVSNQVVNEVGTGGIVAPVILYAPKDGANAKLENIRDLKPTFP
ncbi:MAG: DUF4838 domain-containing protein [Armatimonadota bacterium]